MRHNDFMSWFYMVAALVFSISVIFTEGLTDTLKLISLLIALIFVILSLIYSNKDDIELIKQRFMID